MNNDKTCDKCSDDLAEIRLIDKGAEMTHHDVEYSLPEAKRGFWTGQFPLKGTVKAFMCPRCGRVFLFGVPKSDE